MARTTRKTAAGRGLLLAALVLCAAGSRPVRAQTCDDDGGLSCNPEDDAGPGSDEDGGAAGTGGRGGASGRGGAGGMSGGGGFDAGLVGDSDACSCEAKIDDSNQGRIHVCTQGDSRSACAQFSCERGEVVDELCPPTNVKLCCVMDRRDLVSVLYADCSHANCEAGFRQQCADFAGVLNTGGCEEFIEGRDDDDDGGGGCSVASPHGAADLAGCALGVLGLFVRRRRRWPGS